MRVDQGDSIRTARHIDTQISSNRHIIDLNEIVAVAELSGITASSLTTGSTGRGGNIEIEAGDITLSGGGLVGNITTGSGDAGTVTIRADSLTTFGDGFPLSVVDDAIQAGLDIAMPFDFTGTFSSSGGIISSTTSTGNGGTIDLSIDRISLNDGGQISSSSIGSGARSGRGGAIMIDTRDIRVSGNAGITSVSTGTGGGGTIDITSSERIVIDRSGVATLTIEADGGNITLSADGELRLTDASIATSVLGGRGSGGNIALRPRFLVLNNGNIQANAVGGNGGNIRIVADTIIQSATSTVTATSDLAVDGNIDIESPNQEAETGVTGLSVELLDGSDRLPVQCDARGPIARGKFANRGRGGLGASPEQIRRAGMQPTMLSRESQDADLRRPRSALMLIVAGCRR